MASGCCRSASSIRCLLSSSRKTLMLSSFLSSTGELPDTYTWPFSCTIVVSASKRVQVLGLCETGTQYTYSAAPAALLQMFLYGLGSCLSSCFSETVRNREISTAKRECLTYTAIVSRDQGCQVHLCQLEGVSALLADGQQVSSAVPNIRSCLRLYPSLKYLQQGQEIQGINCGCFKCNAASL